MGVLRSTFNRSTGSGRIKGAAVAAVAGAILVGTAPSGIATASAAPVGLPAMPALPAVELPALPAAPALTDPAAAAQRWFDDQVKNLMPAAPSRALTVQPVSGTLSSGYGARWGSHHGGIDIAAGIGTPVLSAADGEIISAGPASGFGLWVRVRHDDGTVTVYGHINEHLVNVGQRVAAGQQIATVGNRGQSTGPHLHFEVWDPAGNQVDPGAWLQQRGVAVTW
ncbi:M23 family metallopeptidase [Rhodococcus kronopolitis]|uniref:M23 family metallopeptidase n=1 Tax=Rhodococcus kronopolitis TaxID=1460226 RepID=A0ABV9FWB7_9NOCA